MENHGLRAERPEEPRMHWRAERESEDAAPCGTTAGSLSCYAVSVVRIGLTTHLEQAVAAYAEALDERTRARAPLDWAETQNNQGVCCQSCC